MQPSYPSYPSHPSHPGGAEMPQIQRPPAPPSVRTAVRLMYAGAVVSLAGIVVNVATVGATRTAMHNRLTGTAAANTTIPTAPLLIGSIVGGLIAVALWIVMARGSATGHNWARITGTVLFAVATLQTLGGLAVPSAAAAKVVGPVMWLVGLLAVIFLWRRESTAYFRTPRS